VPDPAVPLAKREIFEHSYSEVLAALKHQDEKLNRTLAALAFLTAAGISLFTQFGAGPEQVTFDPHGPSVTAVLFVVFLFAIALALVTALAAIGPNDAMARKSVEGREMSLLFFERIAGDPEMWRRHIDFSDAGLNQLLTRNFHAEALTLSRRVRYKMARSRESGAFVQVAVVSLGLLGIFQTSGDLGEEACWWIATALLLVSIALPHWDALQMTAYGYPDPGVHRRHVTYWLLWAVLGLAAFFLAAGFPETRWSALGYAGVALLFPRLAIAHRKAAVPLMVASTALAVVPLIFLIDRW
jgi:hypothetical protein